MGDQAGGRGGGVQNRSEHLGCEHSAPQHAEVNDNTGGT